MLKHVGQIINTGRRCVVVFREIYNDVGDVVEPDNCLVVETDSLPDLHHQDIMRIVEGEPAQSNGNLYEVLGRERMTDGAVALRWLSESNRLRKYPTNNILLTPDNQNTLRLDKMNRIIQMQASGATQEQIENALVDDTDGPPRKQTSAQQTLTPPTGEPGVLDDSAIAQQRLAQAETFLAEAERLRAEAYELDPTLKPKRGRKAKAKVEA